jgi:hypothetical protein
MKTVIILLQLMLITVMAVAQTNDTTRGKSNIHSLHAKQKTDLWFITIPSVSIGKYAVMPGIGVSYMNKQHFGVAVEFKGGRRNSPNVPNDFNSINSALLFFSGLWWAGDGIPNENSKLLLVSVIKEFENKSGFVVPSIQGGLSFAEKTYPTNFNPVATGNRWFTGGDNYTYQYKTTKSLGLYVKPGLKFLLGKHAALSASAWTVLQNQPEYYGVELGLQFGKLR